MISRSRRCYVLGLFGSLVAVAAVLHWNTHGDAQEDFPTSLKSEALVLLWDSFADFSLEEGGGMFRRFKCPEARCTVTSDRKLLTKSDAVLFHMRETLKVNQIPKCADCPRHQKRVFVLKEPPVYSYFDEKLLKGHFHWTMTYRWDSDMPWPYGLFVQRPTPRKSLPDYHKERPNRLAKMLKEDSSSADYAPVAWIVSRCHSDSKREDYVRELQKHIAVDVYGKCGPHYCPYGNSSKSCQNILRNYHFYLAFENSLCPDYVTEKLFKMLAMEETPVIPVVLGGQNYTYLAPPDSVINAADFNSPKDLAEHLKEVVKDATLYRRYHEWRKRYRITPWGTPTAICRLCNKLHSESEMSTVIPKDLTKFWSKEACHPVLNA